MSYNINRRARILTEKVDEIHMVGHVGVHEPPFRQDVFDFGRPGESLPVLELCLVLHQHSDGQVSEQLRVGGDAEDRL